VKGDRLVAVLFVHRREARDWSVADLELIDAVAARTWDAVERARVEGALREREERYRTLFESIDEGFCILQMILDDAGRPSDYRFLESNPVFERETGLRDAVGRTARELVPNLEQYWIDVYGRVALTGEPVRFVQHAPSMGRWFDVNALRLGAPENLQVALLFNDITERRRTEEEREAQLERERLAREAAEAFLAVMSHELRTPVTSIYGTASLLARNPRRADLVDLVADIQEEAERLQRIIDDLLVLSGVERGLLQLAPEPILLQRTIAEILADMRRRFPTVVFAAQIPGSLSPITADATALRQVLHNLVSNAAKYAGRDGPVTLTVTDADPEITVTVLDEGPGLGADPAALFGLFYRAPHTAKLAAGTGIGLYVANALLRAMGSRIEASTREPRGACFRFSLPKAVDD
jgi:PAS domain S-box-containing protein